MREIFTDLYKKVVGFFQAQENEKEKEGEGNRQVACNRLKLVLMQDRTNLTPFLLERMRGEMIELLSKYVEMDTEALELNFEQEGDSMALMLSIPVLRAKDEEEIQELIKLEEEAKTNAVEAEVSEDDEEISEESEEESEETDEDFDEEISEEVCSCGCEESGCSCETEENECENIKNGNEKIKD
ncbi:MAG: cell division topological specificity factor MinE [bacterium]